MSGATWFVLGLAAGVAGVALIAPTESSCCVRVANGARDKIADAFGGDFTKGVLDGTGLTNALPGLLDLFGVSKE